MLQNCPLPEWCNLNSKDFILLLIFMESLVDFPNTVGVSKNCDILL